MNEQDQWPLEKIRQAYRDILWAWNIIFPPFAEARRQEEEKIPDSVDVDIEEKSSYLTTMGALRKAHAGLKEEADKSGNLKIWTAEEYSQEFLKSLIRQR